MSMWRAWMACGLVLLVACGSEDATTPDGGDDSADAGVESGADGSAAADVTPDPEVGDDDAASVDILPREDADTEVPPDDVDIVDPDIEVPDDATEDGSGTVDAETDGSGADAELDADDGGADVDPDADDAGPDTGDPCVGVLPEPYTCPDGERVEACQCADGFLSCVEEPYELCGVARCDDGTTLACRALPFRCEDGLILTIQDGCWACVNPETCTSAPRQCTDAGGSCVSPRTGCDATSYVDTGYACDGDTVCCLPGRDAHCDDGSDVLCLRPTPLCEPWEILARQNSCERCVNPATCAPWGESTCTIDMDCAASEDCNTCASGSCPACDDCVAACQPHACATEIVLICRCARPECEAGEVSIIRDGCWECVDSVTCAPTGRGCGTP